MLNDQGSHTQADDLYAKLTAVFREVFDNDQIILKPELTADDFFEWDSFNHIRLILTIQHEFGIKFSAAQAVTLNNVGEMIALIQSQVRP